MYCKIYPDVIFMCNLLMDYVILSVWAKLCRITTTYARLALAALVGAIWSVIIAVFTDIPTFAEVFCTYFVIGIIMIYTAGLRGGIKKLCPGLAVFYGVALAAGGLMGLVSRNGAGTLKLAIVCVLFYQGAEIVILLMKKYVMRKNLLYGIVIEKNGLSVRTMGLLDTGNMLSDPYNGRPVCVAESRILKKIGCCNDAQNGIRLIPYKSLGNKNGLMRLVTADSMAVEYDGRVCIIDKPEFAVYEGNMSADGEYAVIINVQSIKL